MATFWKNLSKRKTRIAASVNATSLVLIAVYLFILPMGTLVGDLNDPGLRTGKMPAFAFRWHRSLSERYQPWAVERVASGQAAHLGTSDISGTEWPIFSSVFYLWATEALQDSWEKDSSSSPVAPKEYAREAIAAAAALVADPNHAAWVKAQWGANYLHREDLFYRMLLISGLTSYQKLSGLTNYAPLLRDQVESLAAELDASPYGLLDDYPGQCYPIDILPAIAAIRRADAVLYSDHSSFVRRALRAFQDTRLDPRTGLPAYVADSTTGQGIGSARGVGLSFMLTWAPELWPDTAQQWYKTYSDQFWQPGWALAGFREFPKNYPFTDWLFIDVDAGPVIAGYSTGASAFGLGAARVNGHFEQAYPLGAQALVVSWPLPDGTLLAPRLLSNLSDAPFVGEAALLFSFTRAPLPGAAETAASGLPFSVYAVLLGYLAVAVFCIEAAFKRLRYIQTHPPAFSDLQFGVWLALTVTGVLSILAAFSLAGGLLLVTAQFLPGIKQPGGEK